MHLAQHKVLQLFAVVLLRQGICSVFDKIIVLHVRYFISLNMISQSSNKQMKKGNDNSIHKDIIQNDRTSMADSFVTVILSRQSASQASNIIRVQ